MRTSPTVQKFVTEAAERLGYSLEDRTNERLLLDRTGRGPLVVEVLSRNVVAVSDFHDPEYGPLDLEKDSPFVSCEFLRGREGWILIRVWPANESIPETYAQALADGSGVAEIASGSSQSEATEQMEAVATAWVREGAGLTGRVQPSLG